MLLGGFLLILLWQGCVGAISNPYIKFESNVEESFWSQWSEWSRCTSSLMCLAGTRTRQRKCMKKSPISKSCIGEYSMLEGCPTSGCKVIQPMVYTDVAEAALSSFISQECNTDAKYSVASKRGRGIPQVILQRFQQKLMYFLHGFFNMQKFKEQPEKGLKNMTKVCFEPRNLLYKDLPQLFRFNRLVKASLLSRDQHIKQDDVIYGLAVVTEDDNGIFHGIYFAIKDINYGYKTVGYRRWRGQGVLDAL